MRDSGGWFLRLIVAFRLLKQVKTSIKQIVINSSRHYCSWWFGMLLIAFRLNRPGFFLYTRQTRWLYIFIRCSVPMIPRNLKMAPFKPQTLLVELEEFNMTGETISHMLLCQS